MADAPSRRRLLAVPTYLGAFLAYSYATLPRLRIIRRPTATATVASTARGASTSL